MSTLAAWTSSSRSKPRRAASRRRRANPSGAQGAGSWRRLPPVCAATTSARQALAGEVEQLATSRRLNPLLAVVQLARGSGWLAAGRYTEAFDALVRIFNPADPSYHAVERSRGVMFLAEAAARADRVAHACTIIAELERAALITPSPTLHRPTLIRACGSRRRRRRREPLARGAQSGPPAAAVGTRESSSRTEVGCDVNDASLSRGRCWARRMARSARSA